TPGAGKTAVRDSQDEIALEAKGYVIPISKIQVSPKVSGMVMKLFIEEGKAVKKGFVLAELETDDYQYDFDRWDGQVLAAERRIKELTEYRQKEIEQAKAELDDTEEQCVQLKKDLDRSKHLYATKALSDREWELAESSYNSMVFRREKLRLVHDLMKG